MPVPPAFGLGTVKDAQILSRWQTTAVVRAGGLLGVEFEGHVRTLRVIYGPTLGKHLCIPVRVVHGTQGGVDMYLDLAKAQELVDSAIAEMGADYVYPNSGSGNTCSYVDESYDDQGMSLVKGCIVGHAFINAGFNMEELYNSGVNHEGSNSLLTHLDEEGFISGYNEEARVYLALLQRSQDFGKTWGEANEQAKLGNAWSVYSEDWVEAQSTMV